MEEEEALDAHLPPAMHLMAQPEKGFPIVHGLEYDEVYKNVHSTTKEAWRAVSENKILIYIASDRPVNDTSERVDRLRNFFKILFPDTKVKVGSAKPIMTHTPNFKPIFPYLIAGLSLAQQNTILSMRVWSTNVITFFAIPYEPPVSPYTLSLVGIQLTPPHENEEEIANAVSDGIRNSHAAINFIAGHRDNIDPNLDDDEAIQYILDNVTVRGEWLYVDGRRRPIFFVYIHPPTKNSGFHKVWLSILRKRAYPTMYGVGQHQKNHWRCNICKGLDHPTSLCKYPGLAGWNKPPHFSDEGTETNEDTAQPAKTEKKEKNDHRQNSGRGRARRM